MQRCLFFVFLSQLLQPSFLIGQNVSRYTLDLYVNALQTETIDAQVEISLATQGLDSLKLACSEALHIHQVRWREGRIKGNLPYRREGKTLQIAMPASYNARGKVVIAYTLQLGGKGTAPFIEQQKDFLALNPSAMYSNANIGFAGLFFPAVADDKAIIETNVSHPGGLNVKTLGEVEFYTTEQEERRASFWSTTVEMNPALFFLLVGEEGDLDPEELDEIYAFTELSKERLLSMRLERELADLLPYLKAQGVAVDDAFYEAMDAQKEMPPVVFFVGSTEVPGLGENTYALYNQAFVVWKQQPEAASQAFTQYLRQTKGETWYRQLLQEKWIHQETKSKELLSRYAQLYVEENKPEFPEEALLNVENSLHGDSLPQLSVSYRYVGGQNEQQIFLQQDTAVSGAYSLPIRYKIVSKDSTLQWQTYISKPRAYDTLRVPLNQSPQYVQVSLGRYFPGAWVDEKPDNYSLYQLSNASSSAERQAALKQLFTTQNKNLYSTVVGIALRDESVAIRTLALEAAAQLNAAGAFKLKQQLIKMAADEPEPKLKAQANALVSKYYGG